jgi:hypothetical protein
LLSAMYKGRGSGESTVYQSGRPLKQKASHRLASKSR